MEVESPLCASHRHRSHTQKANPLSTPPPIMFRNQYDTDITTFSPAGRLHQVRNTGQQQTSRSQIRKRIEVPLQDDIPDNNDDTNTPAATINTEDGQKDYPMFGTILVPSVLVFVVCDSGIGCVDSLIDRLHASSFGGRLDFHPHRCVSLCLTLCCLCVLG